MGSSFRFNSITHSKFWWSMVVPIPSRDPGCGSKVHRAHRVLRTTRFAAHQFDLRYEVLTSIAGVTCESCDRLASNDYWNDVPPLMKLESTSFYLKPYPKNGRLSASTGQKHTDFSQISLKLDILLIEEMLH